MKWHFENPEHVEQLRAEAKSWLGTPFFPFSRAKGPGGGIDCVGLAEALMIASGVFAPNEFRFPRRASDYQSNSTENKILEYLRGQIWRDPQSGRLAHIFSEIQLPESKSNIDQRLFMPGDILVMKRGRVAAGAMFHMPIVLGGLTFIDAHSRTGVSEGHLHDPTFSDHYEACFRARRRT